MHLLLYQKSESLLRYPSRQGNRTPGGLSLDFQSKEHFKRQVG
jgi:hypothetical protein